MSRRSIPLYLLLPMLLIAAWTGLRVAAQPDDDRARTTEAAYYYLEGIARREEGNVGSAFYMLQRARQLDTADLEIAGAYSELAMILGRNDSAQVAELYNTLKRRFLANPKESSNGIKLINMANALGMHGDVAELFRVLKTAHPDKVEYALEYAYAHARDYKNGNLNAIDESLAVLDSIEQRIGMEPMIVYAKIRVLSTSNDTARAVAEVGRLPYSAPDNPRVWLVAGELFQALEMPDSALRHINTAIQMDSTLGEAYLARIQVYMAEGDSAAYKDEVENVLNNDNIDIDSKLDILADYMRSNYSDRDHTENVFNRMLEIHPGEATLHQLYGTYLASWKDYAAASEQFGYAMDLDPEDHELPQYKMHTALAAGDTIGAIEAMRTAAARIHDPGFNISGSALLHMAGRDREALELIESFVPEPGDHPHALSVVHQQRGDVLYNLGQVDSALSAYRRSLVYDPNNAGSLNNLAYFMIEAGDDLAEAEVMARRAVKAEPENPTYIDTYAWVLYNLGDYEGAKLSIDDAIRIHERSLMSDTSYFPEEEMVVGMDSTEFAEQLQEATDDGHNSSVDSDEEVAKVEEMAEVIVEEEEEVLAMELSSEIYDHAGDIYFRCGYPDEALRFWQTASELDPENKAIKTKLKTKSLPPDTKNKPSR